MQISPGPRWLLLLLLLTSVCFLEIYGKGGRGGGSRGGSRGSGSRGSSGGRTSSTRARPATYRPAPAPAPTYRPAPAPAATYKPAPYKPSPAPAPRPAPSPKPSAPVVAKQPAENPNFRESNQGSSNNQPAYNPNYKPGGNAPGGNAPGGPPPPYSPGGQQGPSAPVGPPPPYGAPGQRPPYPPGGQAPSNPGQPPPYPGNPGYPPSYPGLPTRNTGQNPPYPVQPGYPGGHGQNYPAQPGSYPGGNRPYPVQPGYPGGHGQPYPVQPGSYPGGNRPYPVQPGSYPGGRPYPVQQGSLGSNVWHPQSGMPAPNYMNSGGLPTGANMYGKSHKQKGFMGSLMSMGSNKHKVKQNKYYGAYPSPYGGMGHMGGGGMGGMGHMGGKMGGFMGGGRSAAMYTILPFVAGAAVATMFRPRLGYMSMYSPMPYYHHHHYRNGEYNSESARYYDVYDSNYMGKCQQPLKKEHAEVKCKTDQKEAECQSLCDVGYEFPDKIGVKSNKCWHMTGVWRPSKNFPECEPVCEEECQNGGMCVRPAVCRCQPEYRGDRCQFHFLKCDVRELTKTEKAGWVCSHSKNETSCKIRCKPPAEFETPPADEYKCSPDGKWTPDSLPHCIENSANKTENAVQNDESG